MTGPDRKVLHVLGSSAGGVARHVSQLVSLFTDGAGGWSVSVAGPTSVRPTVEGRRQDVTFHRVEIADRPGPRDVATVRALRGLAGSTDVVHAHGLRAGALAVLATRAMRERPRVVVTLHNLPVGPWHVRAVSGALELVVARGSDVVLGVSGDLVTRALARGARSATRALVPAPGRPAVSRTVGDVRDDLGVGPDEKLLVTVARLAPQKGLDVLCAVAEGLRGRAGRFVWAVAGGGPLDAWLQAEVARRDLPVRLLGFRDDAPDLLAAADVVVSTAVWEGQPIWLQEALAAPAAIVATDAGGTGEVTGGAARLVPPGDVEALVEAVTALMEDDAARRRLVVAAAARAAELPTEKDVVASLRSVYVGQDGSPGRRQAVPRST
ncbi:glycosyltransferase family 4 protein [Sanguibacter suaedae]|uniref:Glycosyltransferase family 4 protein n=1 Tax=Sanguibacter suaedae TaxID=2795737 RepID=A0A934IAW6_9MICO|nr:glycosyltransferase family 4 protein [Sanguibacter suaedae]MBI9116267.1 glycosyltransferase family 4 protein [Sanguibacter suaedae]